MAEPHPVHDHRTVSPDDVVAPPSPPGPVKVRPEHLYKAVGLLFLLAILFRFLPTIIHTLLLAYASVLLAVALNAVVRALPMRRKWVTAVLGVVILAVIAGLLAIGLPPLFAQLRDLVGQAPQFERQLTAAEAWIRTNTGLNIRLVGPQAERLLRETFLGGASGSDLLSRAQGVIGALFLPLLILFGALYATAKPNEQLLNPLLRAVPRAHRLAFRRIFQLLGTRLLGYVRGVLISMLFVGVLSYLLYALIGVPNALLLALISALAEAIPLLGPWIGGGVATIAALVVDPTKAIWTALAAVVVQQIEGNLLMPWAMSRTVEVHPFVTLFALVLFGSLFGFLGVLLSIPLVLLIATLIEVLWVERAIDTDRDPIAPVVRE